MAKGPYDIGLVEGSITTQHDAEQIPAHPPAVRMLVTIGACATRGGIQALRNWKDVNEFVRYVYASPITSTR
jgi:coenzyme F420-reducing hydrogenase gamma subunit